MPRIDDVFLGCVGYIYRSVSAARKGEGAGATGFLIASRLSPNSSYGQTYIVTNKHVIQGLQSTVIAVRFNAVGKEPEILQTKPHDWILDSSTSDLAVIPVDLSGSQTKGCVIPDSSFMSEKTLSLFDIGPGDETFMVGRLIGYDGKQKNTPVVRFGNISMMPIEPIRVDGENHLAFLVECRSLSGFSGSPVFVSIPAGTWRPNHQPFKHPCGPWLLGVNFGHVYMQNGKSKEHVGMEAVVPAWKLQSLLNLESLSEQRKQNESEIERRERRGFIAYDDLNSQLRRLASRTSEREP